jgi:hypothetical protein
MEEYKKTNADIMIRQASLAYIDELINLCRTGLPS